MKPFNLEAALAGKPVVTRDRVPVAQLHLFSADSEDYPLCGVRKGLVVSYTATGRSLNTGEASPDDLFMASEKREGWVNLYRRTLTNNNGIFTDGLVLLTEAAASLAANSRYDYIGAFLLTWEE